MTDNNHHTPMDFPFQYQVPISLFQPQPFHQEAIRQIPDYPYAPRPKFRLFNQQDIAMKLKNGSNENILADKEKRVTEKQTLFDKTQVDQVLRGAKSTPNVETNPPKMQVPDSRKQENNVSKPSVTLKTEAPPQKRKPQEEPVKITKPVEEEKRIRYTREFLLKVKTAKICDELSFKLNLDGKKRINIDLNDVNLEKVDKPFVPSRNDAQTDKTVSFESSIGILLNQIMPHNIPDIHSQLKKLCEKQNDKLEYLASALFNCAIKQSKFSHLFAELSRLFKEELPFRKMLVNSCQTMIQRSIDDIVKEANKSVDDELETIVDENTRAVFQDNRDSVVTKFKEKYFGNIKLFAELFKVDIISGSPFQKEFMSLVETKDLTMRNAEAFLIIYSAAENEIEKAISAENLNQFFTKLKRLMDNSKTIESHMRYRINDVIEKRINLKKRNEGISVTNITLMPKNSWNQGISNPSKAWSNNKPKIESQPVKKAPPKDVELNKDYLQLFIDNDLDYEEQLFGLKEKKVSLQKIVKNSVTDAMEKREDRRKSCGHFLAHLHQKKCLDSEDLITGFVEYCKTIDEDWYENYPMGMDFLGVIMAHFIFTLVEKKAENFIILNSIVKELPSNEESEWSYGLEIYGKTFFHLKKLIDSEEVNTEKLKMPQIPNIMSTFESLVNKSQNKNLDEYIKQTDIAFVTSLSSNSSNNSNDKQPTNASNNSDLPTTSSYTKSKTKESTSSSGPYSTNNSSGFQNQPKPYASKKSMQNFPNKPTPANYPKVNRSTSQRMAMPSNGVAVNSKASYRSQIESPSMGRSSRFYESEQSAPNPQVADYHIRQPNKKINKKGTIKNGKYESIQQKIIEVATRQDYESTKDLLGELDPKILESEEFVSQFSSVIFENALKVDKSQMEDSLKLLHPIVMLERNCKLLLRGLQKYAECNKIHDLVQSILSCNVITSESLKDWITETPWDETNYEKLRSVVYHLFPDLTSS